MATPQAQDRVPVPNQAAVLQELMQLISGGGETRTTRTTGNISWLEQLLAQLQGADYERTLQSVFANAAENIPGLRQQLVHAAGARGGNNTAMEAALQRLLAATTVQAQGQLVEQQQRNQQIQQAAGANVAQHTQRTTQETKPRTATGHPLGDIAAMTAAIQGIMRLTGAKSVQDLFGQITGVAAPAAQGTTAQAPVQTRAAAPVTTAAPTNLQAAQSPQLQFLNWLHNPAQVPQAPPVADFQIPIIQPPAQRDFTDPVNWAFNPFIPPAPAQQAPAPWNPTPFDWNTFTPTPLPDWGTSLDWEW